MPRSLLALLALLLGLAAGAWPAAAARLTASAGPYWFERFAGQPFFTTDVRIWLTSPDGPARFTITGLPAWVTASRLSGNVGPKAVPVRLTIRPSALPAGDPRPVVVTIRSSTGATVRRTVAVRSFADRVAGAALFGTRCTGCHQPDGRGNAPILFGVYGRKAGTLTGYAFSAALKAHGRTWSYDRLDAWLQNPQALVPGTRMGANTVAGITPVQRANLIAHLRALSIR